MKVLHVIAPLGLPVIGFSQWVYYPTAGVPRKADGTPNLAAPAPRLAGGKPDFSGIWHTARIIPCDADLSRWSTHAAGSEPQLDRLLHRPMGRRYARCPHEGFRNDLWADMSGSPLSEVARLTERIRRPNYGTLELEVTVDDSKVYTRPWTVKITQKLELDTELIDEICLENEKSYERMRAVRAEGGVSGRWSAGGDSVFVLRQAAEVVTGQIEGKPGGRGRNLYQ